ncbi:MAG: sigma-54 dependent transcriptional regulator [Candidatus Sumerlaeota bacterium]|nr:sigma-54 dependent transcriptional regulator [Candidatus Sumerlaeota bacterium]
MLLRVTLAIDKDSLRARVRNALAGCDVVIETIRVQKSEILRRLSREVGDVVIVNLALLPPPPSKSVEDFSNLPESPAVVVLVEKEDSHQSAEFFAAGCDAVLSADIPEDILKATFAKILKKHAEVLKERIIVRSLVEKPRLSDFVLNSRSMKAFMDSVTPVVNSDSSLLILGETGVGKERLARAIHNESARADGAFIAVNCGAFPEGLLESELFGHVEGSFTGATHSRHGCFELAHKGTLLLDEVAETPLHLQVKLLRVLQDHTIQRVGGEKTIEVDVRIMAASNRDMESARKKGRFRQDLFYRLSVVTLTVPPLRDRSEDIPVLAQSFVDYLRPRIGRDIDGIDNGAMEALVAYNWPGNVRELANVIERAMLLCRSEIITLADLVQGIRGFVGAFSPGQTSADDAGETIPIPPDWVEQPWKTVRDSLVEEIERRYLTALLKTTGGSVSEAAKRAGIVSRSLFDKMKTHKLRKEDFR